MSTKVEAAEIIIKTTDGNSFKILGQKIDKTTKKTKEYGEATKNADRATKGLTQQSSNSTKNFSKMATMQGGIVSVYATIAAQVFAVSAAFMFLKDAFETRNLIEGQLAFGAATGVAYASMTKSIQEASGGMIQFREAAQAAAIGTAAGLTSSQLERLSTAAKNTSLALGRDLTDSFQRLIRGTTKAEPELLDELGIILRLEPALKKYAISIGKNAQELNQFEKSQAIANEVLDQAESKFAAIEHTMDDSGFALSKFLKAFDDLMKGVKQTVTNMLIPVISFFSNNILALIGSLTLFLVPILRSILPDFDKMAQKANDKAMQHKASIEVEKAALESYKQKLKEVQNAENKEKTLATQKRDKVAGDMGIKSTTTGQLNAVRHYEKQTVQILEGSLKERTGMLKKFNAGQVNDLKLANQRMGKATNDWKLKFQIQLGTLGKSFKVFTSKMKIQWASTMAFMVKGAKLMAKGVNMAMKLMGWVGIILMVIDGLKMLWNWLFPPDEAKVKQQEMVDSMKDKYGSLTEETNKMIDAQKAGVLTYTASVQQIGNAFKSVDLKTVIKDYNQLVAAGKVDSDEAQNSIKATVSNLNKLKGSSTALDPLIKALESGEAITEGFLAEEAKNGEESFMGYAEALMNAATATTLLSEKNKTLTASIRGAMGSIKENKFAGILRNLDDVIETQETAQGGVNKIAQKAAQEGMQVGLVEAQKRRDKAAAKLQKRAKGGKGIFQFQSSYTTEMANLANTLKQEEAALAAQKKKVEAGQDTIDNNDTQLAQNKLLRTAIVKYRDDEFDRIKKVNLANLEGAQISTVNKDSLTKNLMLDNKLLKNADKLAKAKNEQAAAELILARATEDEMADKGWVKQQEENINNAKIKVETEEEAGDRLAEQTSWQKMLNIFKEEDVASTQAILMFNKQNLRVTKNLGQELKDAVSMSDKRDVKLKQIADKTNKITALRTQEERIQQKLTAARDMEEKDAVYILQLENQKAAIGEDILNTQNDITNAYADQLRLLSAQADLERNSQASLKFSNLYGDDKSPMGIMKGAFNSINPNAAAIANAYTTRGVGSRDELVEQNVNALTSEYNADENNTQKLTPQEGMAMFKVQATEAALAVEKAAVASAQIAIETELANSVSSTLKKGFVDMFQALIDGSQSFGDAMKGVMKQVLADLAAAYLQAAALKMLSSMGFGMPLPGARYGGEMSSAGKSFGYGGVAEGPNSGYLATLHGREAVVPLGNDRSIPVEMKGGGGSSVVNVTVNMSNGQASTSVQGEQQMQGMGRAIGGLVQQHLQQELRPGGLLNQQGTKGRT